MYKNYYNNIFPIIHKIKNKAFEEFRRARHKR